MRYLRHWVPALSLVLLGPASAWADHWAPAEITSKFKEIDDSLKKLLTFERETRGPVRRVGSLDLEVRRIRKRLDQIELTLRSLNESVVELRLGLAKEAAARKAGDGTRGRTVARVGSEVTEPAEPVARVASRRMTHEGGFTSITGIVENISTTPLTFVIVRVDFLDSRGQIVKTEKVYTSPKIIGPGGRASFKVNTRRDHRVRSTRVSVDTR